jgi:hypothetical protein
MYFCCRDSQSPLFNSVRRNTKFGPFSCIQSCSPISSNLIQENNGSNLILEYTAFREFLWGEEIRVTLGYPKNNCIKLGIMWILYFFVCSSAKMTSLKDLNLDGNNLSRDDQLGQTLSDLTNLEILDLGYCGLTKIPER